MSTPDGNCECGCGRPAPIATRNASAIGHVKGQPVRFIRGHSAGRFPGHVVEDRGYETPCWAWRGGKGSDGYGLTRHGARDGHKAQAAHRFYYERAHGPIPPAHDLHHRCEQRDCVNPDHVEPMTEADHLRGHSRLDWSDVDEMRRRRAAGGVTLKGLADEFGISETQVKRIVRGENWRR